MVKKTLWLTRALSNFSSMCEFSDQQVASALMGIDSFHTSHKFWTLHSKNFVNYQRENFTEGEMQPVAPSIVDDDMYHALPQDGTVDDDKQDADGVTICRTKDKDNPIMIARQHEQYMRRGDKLKELSPYEWATMIDIRRKKTKTKKIQWCPSEWSENKNTNNYVFLLH